MKTPVVMLLANLFVAHIVWAVPEKMAQFPEGERILYTRIIEAYHHNNIDELKKQRSLLERNYPLSVHLDNSYYLAGMLEYQRNRYDEALKNFDVVRDRFGKSIRRPSAMFGIAMTFDRLNLQAQSQRVLTKIMKEYPGSPEAQRAWMNLRLATKGPRPPLKR